MDKALKAPKTWILGICALVLTSCGGGGGGGTTVQPPSNPPPSQGNGPDTSWASGVFQRASVFKDRCQTVRTGVDSEGTPFTDIAGSELIEKHWLRSWTNETYLWNNEVTDTNPNTVAGRLNYFALLKTLAITPSGIAKDDFHFSEPTVEYLERRNSAAGASYGMSLVAFSTTVPRDFRIRYTEPNSPASAAPSGIPNLVRGTKILSVNGIDLVSGGVNQAEIDILNAGLFPSTVGVTTTFVVRDPGATTNRTITLTAQSLSTKAVNRTSILTTPTGKVGYILFNSFGPYASETEMVSAITAMKAANVNDLVLDLRYNGGGLLSVASEIGYMVAGPARTTGKTFELLRFNAQAGGLNPVTGAVNSPVPFFATAQGFSVASGTPLPDLNLPRVYVLAGGNTCSASEAVVNGLRGAGVDVVLIGGKTCGKPYGFYPEDNCGETYYSIQFQGVNHLGFGDYADGFVPANSLASTGVKIPGCSASDDFAHELGDPVETLLSTALAHRSSGTCPAAPVAVSRAANQTIADPRTAINLPSEPIMSQNRDMTPSGPMR